MSMRRLVSWTLIALLAWPPGALAQQQTGNDSTLLIDRGSTGTMSPAVGAATRAQSDPFTGAATLGFELRVPPGTGGMQPALALAYNNQRRADSWVGYGWSLSLGSIRRSLKRGVPSYDDAKALRQSPVGSIDAPERSRRRAQGVDVAPRNELLRPWEETLMRSSLLKQFDRDQAAHHSARFPSVRAAKVRLGASPSAAAVQSSSRI
jgi:hypothetical protein